MSKLSSLTGAWAELGNIFLQRKTLEQAGAELGQAHLKLELGFNSTNLHQIDEQESLIVLC